MQIKLSWVVLVMTECGHYCYFNIAYNYTETCVLFYKAVMRMRNYVVSVFLFGMTEMDGCFCGDVT